MKPKTMLFLVIILGVLAGISFLIQKMQTPSVSKTSRLGGELLENLPVNDIAAVTIQSDEGTVELGKVDDRWVVKSRYSYPADFKKLIDFVKKWKEAKIGRSFKASPDSLARIQLLPPDDTEAKEDNKGARICLKDAENKDIANIITGKVRETEQRGAGGGQYVRFNESETVFLTDKNFKYMTKDSKGWLDKELLDIKDSDVQKVVFTSWEGKRIYTIQREKESDDAQLIRPPEGRKAKKSEVDSVLRAVASLRIDDIENPEDKQTDKTKVDKLTYYLFNGKVYTFYPEKKFKNDEDIHCLRLEVAFQKPPEPPAEEKAPEETVEATPVPEATTEDAEDKEDEEKEPEKTPEELAYEAETDNKKLSSWTYILPKWKYENFITNIEDLLEEKKEEPPKPPPKAETDEKKEGLDLNILPKDLPIAPETDEPSITPPLAPPTDVETASPTTAVPAPPQETPPAEKTD